MAVKVRRAKITDLSWLFEQLKKFEAFVARKRSLIEDEEFARTILTTLIDKHVVLIAHDGDTRLGFVAGHAVGHPLNPRIRVLSELFWWVAEEHRRTRAAAVLLQEFEMIGRATADWTIFSLEHNSPMRDAHLIKRGFRQIERAYLLEV